MLAISPLIEPLPGLMIWTLVTFGLTYWVLKRYAFGRIQQMIDQRRERIRQAVAEADHAREEARNLLEEHRKLAESRRVSEAQRQRVKEETEADRQRRLEETRRQIEAETRRALEEIRAEVAELSLLAAEKVTRRSLREEDQRRLIDEAIGELDFSVLDRGDGR
jgi:F-type H+-transporting ATPase subunit b